MRLRFLIYAVTGLTLFMIPIAAAAGSATLISGRVFTEAGPMGGAKVSIYKSYADLLADRPLIKGTTADRQGVYSMEIPQGEYYFTARGDVGERPYYAYHGSNPVRVGENKLWLGLMAVAQGKGPAYTKGEPGLGGEITYKGEPVKGAHVALYDVESRTFKGLGVKTESAGNSGRFRIDLPPGRYVVVAKKNSDGGGNRPLQKGDLYCYYPHNPVDVKEGMTTLLDIPCYPKIDRQGFVNTPVVKDDDSMTIDQLAVNSGSGLRGRVVDVAGRPVASIHVMAYPLPSPVFMMYNVYHGSEHTAMTDAAGNYFIPLKESGDYGIVARNILGDGPHRGEIYGLFQGNARHAVSFRHGELQDRINITVGEVMGASLHASADRNEETGEILVGMSNGKEVEVGDSVISRDTIWQGKILVKGVISVRRGATLTIRPGTTVRFKRIDRDLNKVGDGEIMVEGRLIARGEKGKEIVFTSAEERPAINDWSYLQFIAAEPGNIIEHCCFEYAFSGVMVHYSAVRISDSLFSNNNRGLHYNTADLQVEHNVFTDNRIGIRFMRFEGNVLIRDNQISGNDTGILFVRQHVNAVDFERLNRGSEPPRIVNNNITGNRKYNFSLGEGQDRDVEVAGNWWGDAPLERLQEMVYDKGHDSGLSRVIYQPFLSSPVPGAGIRN
jgi:hypothetical protein